MSMFSRAAPNPMARWSLAATRTLVARWPVTLILAASLTLLAHTVPAPGGSEGAAALVLLSPMLGAFLIRLGARLACAGPLVARPWELLPTIADLRHLKSPGRSTPPFQMIGPQPLLLAAPMTIIALVLPTSGGLVVPMLALLASTFRPDLVAYPIALGVRMRGGSAEAAEAAAGEAASINAPYASDNVMVFIAVFVVETVAFIDFMVFHRLPLNVLLPVTGLACLLFGSFCQHAWDEIVGPDASQSVRDALTQGA